MDQSGLRSFWEGNLGSLETINPGLAQEIRKPPKTDACYGVERMQGDRFACRAIRSTECKSIFDSCSVIEGVDFDAAGEWIHPPAREQLPSLSEADLIENDLFVIVRMGLGNRVLGLYDRLAIVEFLRDRNRRIIALEDRVELIRAAFTLYDWRTILESTRFLLLFGRDVPNLLNRFFNRYPFSAIGRVCVRAGSGPSDETSALTATVSELIHSAATDQRSHAEGLITRQVRSRSGRQTSHVRKVLWLVPGHNYLQKRCVKALEEMGTGAVHHLWSAPLYRYVKRYEWLRVLERSNPDAMILVNATPVTFFGGAEVRDLPVLVASWFVDNPQRYVRHAFELEGVDLFASFDRYYLSYLRELGAERAIEVRTAAGLNHDREGSQPEGPPVSFVGELGTRGFVAMDQRLSRSVPELHNAINLALEADESEPQTGLDVLYQRYVDCERFPFRGSIVELVENKATYHRRRKYLDAISDLGLKVFGDREWGNPTYAGPLADCWEGRRLDYASELPSVYAGSEININIFHSQCRSGLNPRVYDVLACGGFLLTMDNPGLQDEFIDGEHLVTFRTPDELREKVRYYLEHSEERRRIARTGQTRVLASCRYHDRMRRVLGVFDRILTGAAYVYPC